MGILNSASAIVTVLLYRVDSDGDGFTPSRVIAMILTNTIYPGAPEICDGKDMTVDGF